MSLKTWVAEEKLYATHLNNNFSEVSGVIAAFNPLPAYPFRNDSATTKVITGNTTGFAASFIVPARIILNKISFYIGDATTPGTVKIGIYSADGQTRLLNETTGTISSAGVIYTHTLSAPLDLQSGQYYIVVTPVGTTNIAFFSYNAMSTVTDALNVVTSEPKIYGTLTVPAGTLPATFNPNADITNTTNSLLPIMRFDN